MKWIYQVDGVASENRLNNCTREHNIRLTSRGHKSVDWIYQANGTSSKNPSSRCTRTFLYFLSIRHAYQLLHGPPASLEARDGPLSYLRVPTTTEAYLLGMLTWLQYKPAIPPTKLHLTCLRHIKRQQTAQGVESKFCPVVSVRHHT